MPRALSSRTKLILDFAPLAVFFAGYRWGDLMTATSGLLVATMLCLAIIYAVERKVALAPLITGGVVLVFGVLTLWLNDERFIKIKPTLINSLFALILLIGVYGFKRGLLNHVLGLAVQMTDVGWLTLSRRWGFFFLFLAGLNEVIWRNFPTDFWVDFKVFGMFTLTMAFAVSQYRLIQKYSKSKR
jgi:intracellular septation protein